MRILFGLVLAFAVLPLFAFGDAYLEEGQENQVSPIAISGGDEAVTYHYILSCTMTAPVVGLVTPSLTYVPGLDTGYGATALRAIRAIEPLAVHRYEKAIIQFASDSYSDLAGTISNASFQVCASLALSTTGQKMVPLKLRSRTFDVSALPTAATARIDTATYTVNSATSVYSTYTDVESAYTPASFESNLATVTKWGIYEVDLCGIKWLQVQMSNSTMPINVTAQLDISLRR